jgi:hypothetical protein
MTFRDRMAADFKAMQDNMPRDMPVGFAPDELWVENGAVRTSTYCVANKKHLELAFMLTDDRIQNARAMRALFQSAWQALELIRLDRADEVETMGASFQ